MTKRTNRAGGAVRAYRRVVGRAEDVRCAVSTHLPDWSHASPARTSARTQADEMIRLLRAWRRILGFYFAQLRNFKNVSAEFPHGIECRPGLAVSLPAGPADEFNEGYEALKKQMQKLLKQRINVQSN